MPRGVFATRVPVRPNPIGLSIVRRVERRGRELLVEDLDVLHGTTFLHHGKSGSGARWPLP